MHRQELLQLLSRYNTPHMEEAAMVNRSRQFIMQHVNCFDRSLMHGHVTGSTWVVNPSLTHALLLHHRKLGLWLQPGGHADGDSDILRVVLKETSEETGVPLEKIHLVNQDIFDVDIHTVHANPYDSRHEHFDIRFLVTIHDDTPIPGNDESHDLGWIPLDKIPRFNNARSIYRMIQKTRLLASKLSA